MKQLVQWPDSGKVELLDVPSPQAVKGVVVVRNAYSAVSPGTERAMLQFGKSSMLSKARSRPDLVRRVSEKARTEGVLAAFEATQRRLKDPTLLGYSSAGVVVELGSGVTGLKVGDRVACGGAGFACHANMVSVPKQLVVPLPETVGLDEAAFAVIAAIPMHGFRLASVGVRDTVVVVGLGLIGQIAAQVAAAAGTQVVAYDPNETRCRIAQRVTPDIHVASSLPEVHDLVWSVTNNVGADAVLICAATTSSDPIALAADVARDRGHVVMIGSTGMDMPRRPFFEKELTFQVSRSYGPGRYDVDYEERGIDYPVGFVKWTEGRNIAAVLDMMAAGEITMMPLVDNVISLEDAVQLYESPSALGQNFGVEIQYPTPKEISGVVPGAEGKSTTAKGTQGPIVGRDNALTLGVVGAGQFARAVLLPAIAKAGGYRLRTVTSARGVSAAAAQRQFGFEKVAESFDEMLEDPAIGTLVIATRHDLHAEQVVRALRSGKRVYVEKPIAITETELRRVADEVKGAGGSLYVGYNRRFAPMIKEMKSFLGQLNEAPVITYRTNAGYIPSDHWSQVQSEGGGRIVGEACHFIDLMMFLTNGQPTTVSGHSTPDGGRYSGDNVVATIGFDNGAVGSLCYTASGDRAAGKERLEVFQSGRTAQLDDFRIMQLAADGRVKRKRNLLRQDKGHVGEWQALRNALLEGAPLIPWDELLVGALCTFRMETAVRSGEVQKVVWSGAEGETGV